jgi:MFS family permease
MPSDHRPRDPYAALRDRYVRPFALGRMVASMATQFVSVAIGWELYERTNDPWALGLVGVIQVAPALALSLPAGSLSDRFPRRTIGLLAHCLLGLAALGLALVSSLRAPVELVYVLLALSGVGRAFSSPSVNSLLAQLLKPRVYASALPWLVSSSRLGQIGGPAAAGLLIALSGAATPAYLVAALGHFAFAGTLRTFPAIAASRGTARPGLRNIFDGVGFFRRSPIFLSAITLDLFAVLLGGAVALLPIYARDILQAGPVGLGLLRSAPSVGALAAMLAAAHLSPWVRPGRALLLTVAGFGLATVGFGLSHDLLLSLACLACVGAFDSISGVIRDTIGQAITPDRLRGRVAAINGLFTGLSNELGAFESGAVAALFSPVIAVVGGGLGTLMVVALVTLACPALLRLGPVHTLHPLEPGQPAVRPATQGAAS